MPSKTKIWKHKSAIVKKGDKWCNDGRPTDVVILIMGPPDVGKSFFINTLFDEKVVAVGHELKSCSANLQHIIHPHPFDSNRRLVVVDTPGFDDDYVDDAEILRRISVWLATSYANDMKLAGVIYLHDISCKRMLGSARKNLYLFRKLCGDDALSSVIIGTTNWSEVNPDVGNARSKQLEDTFWKEMIEGGARVFKFENTQKSAWGMVEYLLHKNRNPVLQLQKELVDLQKIIPDTDVGKELRYTLEQLLEMQKDSGHATEEQIQKTITALQALKVPGIPTRFMALFGLRTETLYQSSTTIRTTSNQQSSRKMGSIHREMKSLTVESTKTTSMMGTVQGEVRKEDSISHATPTPQEPQAVELSKTFDEELSTPAQMDTVQRQIESLTVESTKTTATMGIVQSEVRKEDRSRNVPLVDEEYTPQAHDSSRGDLSRIAEENGVLPFFVEDATNPELSDETNTPPELGTMESQIGGAVSEDTAQQSVTLLQTETTKSHEKVHCTSTSSQSTKFDSSSDFGINGGAFFDGMHASSIKGGY